MVGRGLGRTAGFAVSILALAFSFVFIFTVAVFAQAASTDGQQRDRSRHEPGRFDFYVLALSWSPSYCDAVREKTPDRMPQPQCGGRPFSFVVHGLWPQYERGFPSFCQRPAPRVDRDLADGMLDLMPSRQLVFHEWNRHGTCTGLSANDYFEAVRKARAAVKVPADYLALGTPIMVKPGDVAAAFLKSNPSLSSSAMAVACDGKRLTEVRICLTKDFAFRDCPEVARRACRLDKVAMPAVRGGN